VQCLKRPNTLLVRMCHLCVILCSGVAVSAPPRAHAAAPANSSPVPPPPDAQMLFDGRDLSGWLHRGSGAPARWKVAGGAAEVVPGTGDITTKQQFTDCQLHVEFRVPLMPDAHGQARGNSGVYLQGLYEVQVLDSYGLVPKNDDCGAIYEQAPPMVNACRPPEQWQTYDILFHAPRFDAAGQMTEKPRISVLQNGIWIQDNVSINHPTRASMERDVHGPGPIMLQDHGNRVRYRNIWVRPLAPSATQ
jgi:hypothetical protein